jgi:hypothetical protein
MVEASSVSSVVVFGLEGKGKSTVLNTLKDGNPSSNSFRTGKSHKAVTTVIQREVFSIHG